MFVIQPEEARREHDVQLANIQAQVERDSAAIARDTKNLTRYGVIIAVIVTVLAALSLVAVVYFGVRAINASAPIATPTASHTL